MTRRPDTLALYLEFCIAIRSLTRLHRVSVTSWWRSHEHNRNERGLPGSRHLDGVGADLILDQNEDRAAVMKTARSLGLQVVDERDHLHVELDPV